MGLLSGKTALIFGIANKYSLAWGIAQALAAEGAEIGFSYAIEKLERRVRPLAESIGSRFVERCDVTNSQEIADVVAKAAETFGRIDLLVHAVAFAETDDFNDLFLNTSREGFHTAMDISVYSLVSLTRAVRPLMSDGGAIVTLSYYGAEKVVPRYNVMGVAKAALEASARYLAAELGQQNIRVNTLSAGPCRTLSSMAVGGIDDMLEWVEKKAPLQRNIETDEVGRSAVYLVSDLSSGVTGENLYVDAGYNTIGL